MIQRYTRPEMGRIWSDENKFQTWLEVEIAAAEAFAERGEVPAEAARALREHAGFDVARILEIEVVRRVWPDELAGERRLAALPRPEQDRCWTALQRRREVLREAPARQISRSHHP